MKIRRVLGHVDGIASLDLHKSEAGSMADG